MKQGILLLLLCNSLIAYAQTNSRITGEVTDSATQDPLPLVTVALVSKTTGKTQSVFSDSLGRYNFQSVPSGTYYLLYSFIGYDSLSTDTFEIKDNLIEKRSKVALNRKITSLKEVTITATKPLLDIKADGLVYNAASEPQLAGSNTLDLLRKVPLVIVDPNGGIGVAGGSNTKVFIDGKPATLYGNTPADYLTLLPADRIEKVQVITQPSAKYDAEGTGMVILIFTKKNRFKNLTGTIRTMAAAGSYRNALQNGLSLFYKWKKIALSTGVSYTSSMRIDKQTLSRSNKDHSSSLEQVIFDTMRRNNPTFNLNLDIELDSLSSLNINGTYVRWKTKDHIWQENNLLHNMTNDSYDRNIFRLTDISVYTTSLAYSRKFKQQGRELSFLGFYNKRDRDEAYHLTQYQQSVPGYTEDFENPSVNKEWSLQLDYVQPVINDSNQQTGKWETGIRVSLRNVISDFQTFPFEQERSGNFSYDQHVYAAYLNYEITAGKWSFRPGLRYERTMLNAYFNKDRVQIRPYGNLVPYIAVSRRIKDRDILSFSYTQSISRPFLSALNPAINSSDSLNITKGNPELRPAITHQVEAAYTFTLPKNGFLRLGLYGSKTNNSLVQVTRLLPNNVAQTSWENAGLDQKGGAFASWNQPVSEKLRITVNMNGGWQQFSIPSSVENRSGWAIFTSFYFTYNMGKGYNMEGFIMAQSRRIEVQGISSVIIPQYYLLAIGKKLWKDKAGISLRTDSFLTPRQPFTSKYYYPGFIQTNINYLSNQLFQFAFNWRLNVQTSETKSRAARKAQEVPVE